MNRMYAKIKNIIINIKAVKVCIFVLFFAFQRQMISISNVFSYIDELFAIAVIVRICILILKDDFVFFKIDWIIFTLMLFLAAIGIFGNIHSGILENSFLITVDIISIYKVLIAYYWIRTVDLPSEIWDLIIRTLSSIVRIFLILMMFNCVISYVGLNTNMLSEVRYGISSFKYTFNVAGNYSKFFYFAIPLLSADLMYSTERKKIFFIGVALVLWLTTLRSRAFAYVLCYLLLSFWYFKVRNQNVNRLKIINIAPIIIVTGIINWEQLVYYLTNETQARANMLRYSIVNAKVYFPFGSGFGTYGSDVAAKTYSSLYTKYGFNNIYGMGYRHTRFLNDNYWPMILGQFGFVGMAIMIAIIYYIYKQCLDIVRDNKYFYFASICSVFFLLSSSIASKSYSEFTSIAVLMVNGIMAQRELSLKKQKYI